MSAGKIFKSKIFWTILVIVPIVAFVLGVKRGGVFVSETDVLIIPKSEKAAVGIEQIAGNAQSIPRSLSFYNKMLEINPDIEDEFAGLSGIDRKEAWNSKLQIKKVGGGMIKIMIFDQSQWQAELISRQTASDLIFVLGKYYDLKNDLDVRIVDGPLSGGASDIATLLGFTLIGLAVGFFAGLAAAVASVYLSGSLLLSKASQLKIPYTFSNFQKMTREKKESLEKAAKKEATPATEQKIDFAVKPPFWGEQKPQAEAAKKPTGFEKKSFAPSNLPVAEEFVFPVAEEKKADAGKKKSEADLLREATPEEVRERLNKLLHGNMQ